MSSKIVSWKRLQKSFKKDGPIGCDSMDCSRCPIHYELETRRGQDTLDKYDKTNPESRVSNCRVILNWYFETQKIADNLELI